MLYLIGFVTTVLIPFILAGLGAHLAVAPLPDPKVRRKLYIFLWTVAAAGVVGGVMFGVMTYRSDKRNERETKDYQQEVKNKLDAIIKQPDSSQKKADALALKQDIGSTKSAVTKTPSPQPKVAASNSPAPIPIEDAQMKLLHDADTTYNGLSGWHTATIRDRQNQEAQRKLENEGRKATPEFARQQIEIVDEMWWQTTYRDYEQTYADHLIALKRDLLAEVPETAPEASIENWQNPSNSGEITGIRFALGVMVGHYRLKLRKEGKLTGPLTETEQWLPPTP